MVTKRTRRTRTAKTRRRIKSNRRTRRQNFRKRRQNFRKRSRRNLYKGGAFLPFYGNLDESNREEESSSLPAPGSTISTSNVSRFIPPVHEVDPSCIQFQPIAHKDYINADHCCNEEYRKNDYLEIPEGCRVLRKDAHGVTLLEATNKWSFGQEAPRPKKRSFDQEVPGSKKKKQRR